jgi:hypothetical protein
MTSARLALFAAAILFAAGYALAQSPVPQPPPLPPPDAASSTPAPVPPPPPDYTGDPDLEPQVTIIKRDDQVVEEVRIKGELRYVRVTPRHGRPYFLIPDGSGFAFIRRDSLDIQTKVPMWVLWSW